MIFRRAAAGELTERYRTYAARLRLADTFWEHLIQLSEIHTIWDGERLMGCCSILAEHPYCDTGMLSSLFLEEEFFPRLGAVFAEIRARFTPLGAYVVSSDEPFLSVCTDAQRKLDTQAYFFDYIPEVDIALPAFPASALCRAGDGDWDLLEQTAFYDRLDLHTEENRIYLLRGKAGAFLGTGHIERMQFARQWGAVGMYTAPEHRGKGVGRSIILHLTKIAQKDGLLPIAGCSYCNQASRATLESCGFFSRTRYLKLLF